MNILYSCIVRMLILIPIISTSILLYTHGCVTSPVVLPYCFDIYNTFSLHLLNFKRASDYLLYEKYNSFSIFDFTFISRTRSS